MVACVCLLLWCLDNRIVVFDDTDIYKKLNRYQTAISDHQVFILDEVGKRILHYQENGRKLNDIGRAGKGPGEFTQPKSIFILGDTLYAFDRGRIHAFSLDGRVLNTFKKSPEILYLYKVADGLASHVRTLSTKFAQTDTVSLF